MPRGFSKIFLVASAFSALAGLSVLRVGAQQIGMTALVAPLAKEISHSHKRKIVVFPLIGENRENALIGVQLAKQISLKLAETVPRIETFDASSSNLPYAKTEIIQYPIYDHEALKNYANRIGADLVITGSYAPFESSLGVSLILTNRNQQKILATSNGRLGLDSEVKDLITSSAKLKPPPDGFYLAGMGGVGMPRCLKCPDPKFPEDERSKGIQGQVILQAVVGTDGLLSHVEVLKSPSASCSEAAIAAVREWQFDPASGPDGKPVAVRVPVQVSFRLRGY